MTRARRSRRVDGHGSRSAELHSMPVRSTKKLLEIREQHGSAILAAINGAVNAEEYLKLEQLSEH